MTHAPKPEIDLDALEAIAKAATPGPWDAGEPYGLRGGKYFPVLRTDEKRDADYAETIELHERDNGEADAAHIAAFDPPTVLALIERARQADIVDDGPPDFPTWRAAYEDMAPRYADLTKRDATIATLSAELEVVKTARDAAIRELSAQGKATGQEQAEADRLSAELEAVKAKLDDALALASLMDEGQDANAGLVRKLAERDALIEKAVEALGPIVRAIDACEAADGNLPDEMSALRLVRLFCPASRSG